MIVFLQNNYEWIAAIIMAFAAIITACAKFFKKSGRNNKQKVGDISNSNVININGDYNNK